VDDGTMMTNAAGGIMSIAPDPRNPPQSTTCSGAFSGSVGTASCDAIFEYSPMDQPVVADKTYAHVGIACTIACGDNNTCPGTLRCDTALGWCVPPL
jgi:hypothetical protein